VALDEQGDSVLGPGSPVVVTNANTVQSGSSIESQRCGVKSSFCKIQ
jgi:hypothetical protein